MTHLALAIRIGVTLGLPAVIVGLAYAIRPDWPHALTARLLATTQQPARARHAAAPTSRDLTIRIPNPARLAPSRRHLHAETGSDLAVYVLALAACPAVAILGAPVALTRAVAL